MRFSIAPRGSAASASIWRKIYALSVDDPDRSTFAVIDGKLFKGKVAVKATARLLKRKSE